MRVTIVASGKLKSSSSLHTLILDYLKQLKWKVDIKEIDAKSHEKNYEKNFMGALPKDAHVIALDERGKSLSSQTFAQHIESVNLSGQNHLCFLIGGADGLPLEAKKMSQKTLSFGQSTWPHMMVRLMLIEQLYRAQQILAGHPYHRE